MTQGTVNEEKLNSKRIIPCFIIRNDVVRWMINAYVTFCEIFLSSEKMKFHSLYEGLYAALNALMQHVFYARNCINQDYESSFTVIWSNNSRRTDREDIKIFHF